MSFISLSFAVFFLVLVILYRAAIQFGKHSVLTQKIILLVASLVFYAWADLRFVPFLAYAIAVSYLGGLCMERRRHRRFHLFLFVAICLAPLLFFKYAPREFHPNVIFPLGISFFTFQSVGYIADIYKQKITAERNPLDVALFVCFFPTVTSGPIQRAGSLIPQFNKVHGFDYGDATDGLKLFAWGMFKKLVIADRIALYVNYVYGNVAGQYGLALLLATLLYSFQIYCDFSGYTDMAAGAARYLGFDIGKNFDHPYLSKSVGEFWRRWHISLSSWLRDYVYIPLGGSRVALPRVYINLIATFLASGIWHGSTWNFVIWGLLHGFFLCGERMTKEIRERMKIPSWLNVVVTFFLVTFAWIFFRARNLAEAAAVIKKIAVAPTEIVPFINLAKSEGLKEALHKMLSMVTESGGATKGMAQTICLLASFVVVSLATLKKPGLDLVRGQKTVVRWTLYLALAFATMFFMSSSYSGNFIYQSF